MLKAVTTTEKLATTIATVAHGAANLPEPPSSPFRPLGRPVGPIETVRRQGPLAQRQLGAVVPVTGRT